MSTFIQIAGSGGGGAAAGSDKGSFGASIGISSIGAIGILLFLTTEL